MARLPLAGAGACALLLVLLGACGGAGPGREPTPPAPADPCLSPSQFDACITEQLGRAVSHQVTVDWPAKLDTRGLVPMRLRHSGEVRVVIGPGLTEEAASAVQSGSRGVHTRDQTLARLTSTVVVSLSGRPDAITVDNVPDGSAVSRPSTHEVDKTLTLDPRAPLTLRWEVTPIHGGQTQLTVAVATVVRDGHGQAQPPTPVWSDQANVDVSQSTMNILTTAVVGAQSAAQLWPLLIPLLVLAGAVVAIRHHRLRPYAAAVIDKLPGLNGLAEAAMGDADPQQQTAEAPAAETAAQPAGTRATGRRRARLPATRQGRPGRPRKR